LIVKGRSPSTDGSDPFECKRERSICSFNDNSVVGEGAKEVGAVGSVDSDGVGVVGKVEFHVGVEEFSSDDDL
jgi:hypothetical protein